MYIYIFRFNNEANEEVTKNVIEIMETGNKNLVERHAAIVRCMYLINFKLVLCVYLIIS